MDLQEDLQLIYSWADQVNMRFNSDKFECLRYWSDPSTVPVHQYLSPDNQKIKVKSDLRDLGVQLSSNLSFAVHIENTVTAASKLVGWGLRIFWRKSRKVMLTLLKSLAQPKLDYCSLGCIIILILPNIILAVLFLLPFVILLFFIPPL